MKIPGRTYEIEVKYLPIMKEKDSKSKSSKIDVAPYIRLMQLIDQNVHKSFI
jgi:hypothetical protein